MLMHNFNQSNLSSKRQYPAKFNNQINLKGKICGTQHTTGNHNEK